MNERGWKRMALVVAVCALVGALAGIAGSAAAPSKSKSSAKAKAQAKAKAKKHAAERGFRFKGPGRPAFGPMGGPLHAETVVPQADGSGFDTITMDSGVLKSVDGNTLHIKQADGDNVYKDDAAVTVKDGAKVVRNHEDAKLSDLKEGDHVHVITGGEKGDVVIAEDDAFIAQEKKKFRDFGPGRHHGHGFGMPGPPPPGAGGPAPGDPGSYPGDDSKSDGSNS